eukprot:403334940
MAVVRQQYQPNDQSTDAAGIRWRNYGSINSNEQQYTNYHSERRQLPLPILAMQQPNYSSQCQIIQMWRQYLIQAVCQAEQPQQRH